MNPTNLAGLFSALKNPTAKAAMAAALPTYEEWNPTDDEFLFASFANMFDKPVDGKSPREKFFENIVLDPYSDPSASVIMDHLESPILPEGKFINLTDKDIGILADNATPSPISDASFFRNARKMLEERLRRFDLGLPVPSEFSYPDDGLDDLPF